jgi:hypothetical protein
MFSHPLLQLGEPGRHFTVGSGKLPHLHEGPHNGDVHLHGSLAVEYAGEHRNPLLGKNVGEILAV